MSPNDYNERFYQLVRRESFYAKRLSAMNEEICEAFLNISRFLIDEGYVSNNAREVDNIVEALPEQALANMFDDDTFATKFKIALKAVNPRLSENALSGEKRQAAAIALKLLEYSKNNATYLKPGAKAPKDPEGAAGEYNPKGAVKKPVGGSGAIDASLKGKVSQTEESDPILLSRQGKNPDGSSKMVGTPGPSVPGSKPKRPEPKNTNRPNSSVSSPGYDTRRIGGYDLTRLSNSFEPEGEMTEEGYKPIDKKKENAMYRRAGNLARTSLSSKGKKKEEAQKKSAKIVSAITRQKEDERFERIGKDPKHQNNYKEEVEIQEEEGKKDACYKKVKARYDVWPSAYASGALVKCRQKGAANWGNKSEAFDIDALLDDPIFDQITEEELMHLAFDIFEEMEYEGILAESLEYFDDMFLSEEQDAGAVAKGRLERKRMSATAEGPEAGSREYKKKKVMGALKTAAKAVKEKGSAAAGRASEVKKRAGEALKGAKDTAGRAVKAVAKGGASLAKKAATKTAAAAGEVAGAAKGGFEAGRIKAKREAMSKTKPQAKPSSSGDGDTTKGKLDDLLKDVRGGGSKPASSGGSSGSSGGGRESAGTSDSGGTQTRKRGLLRRIGSAIKTGIKKVVGKTARGVSGVAGKVASRMGEDTEFDIILDYLLEHDVCSLDEAEEVMMELTEEEIENILTEREMTAADKAKEKSLKKKYDPSGMKASMKKQYGAEKGKQVYFATIRKQAMEEVEQVDENRRAARSAGGYKDDSKKQTDPSKEGFTGISGSIKDIMRQNREIEARKKKEK